MLVKIFFCYAHEDEGYLKTLKRHLVPLERDGLIKMWYDRDISAGTKWEQEIRKHLNEANIVLLLISHHFMSSEYCYSIELEQAIKRQERGEARVIPIILSPVYWQIKPLVDLQVLPREARPVTKWPDENDAYLNIANNIRKIAKELATRTSPSARNIRFRVTDHPMAEVKNNRNIFEGLTPNQLSHSDVKAELKSPEATGPLYYQSGPSRRTRLILAILFIILTLLLISGIVAAAFPSGLSTILNAMASNLTLVFLLALLAFAVLVTMIGFLLSRRH